MKEISVQELKQLIEVTENPAEKKNLEKRAQDFTKRTSFNLIGVRKDRAPEQKQRFYDPENLTLSYSFTEVEHHDFEIESSKVFVFNKMPVSKD